MITASYVLHYGCEYLAWSIRSIQDCVDEIQILYSPKPSFSFQSPEPCPESEADLQAQAHRFLAPGKTLHWTTGTWSSEGAHRDAAVKQAFDRGSHLLLVVDADEIWDPATLRAQLAAAGAARERDTLAPFCHFWRSFSNVCIDPSRPVRILNLRSSSDLRYADQKIPVLHFGYAQSEAITRYKISIHGHRGEWRPDWLEGKFLAWQPGVLGMKDVHPTCGWNPSFGDYFWTPRPVPQEIQEVVARELQDHPYRGMEIIR
jgi:hypothetical protein